MNFSRWFITFLLLCGALAAALADEQVLATIHIGMKPKELKDLLGEPTAIIIAQPPLPSANALNPAIPMGFAGKPLSALTAGSPDKQNTMVLITGEGHNKTETELAPSGEESGKGPKGQPGINGPMGRSAAIGPGTETKSSNTTLPIWAYTVRVSSLSLDQQELIYRINKTYSLGIVITGQGAEAKVSDVVACSFMPFSMSVSKSALVSRRMRPDFTFDRKKGQLPATTSKMVTIGSTLAQVLKAHLWPTGFLPFVADQLSIIPLAKLPDNIAPPPSTTTDESGSKGPGGLRKKTGIRGSGSPFGHSPGEQSPATTPVPQTSASLLSPDGSLTPDNLSRLSLKPIADTALPRAEFQNGAGTHLVVPFTDSCLLIYPDDQVEFTIIHSLVVRIHIGKGVIRPETPIPPSI